MRIGQKNKLTYRWARKGSRPHAIRSTHPVDLLVRRGLPRARSGRRARAAGLQQRSHAASSRGDHHEDRPGAHAILILDQAGWHGAKDLRVSSNISLLPLPPRAPSSTAKKISGSSYARTGFRTASSNPSTTSSTTAATPGTPSPITVEDHVHCLPRLGSRRSLFMRIGIRSSRYSVFRVPRHRARAPPVTPASDGRRIRAGRYTEQPTKRAVCPNRVSIERQAPF
jgi:hypothetical protein